MFEYRVEISKSGLPRRDTDLSIPGTAPLISKLQICLKRVLSILWLQKHDFLGSKILLSSKPGCVKWDFIWRKTFLITHLLTCCTRNNAIVLDLDHQQGFQWDTIKKLHDTSVSRYHNLRFWRNRRPFQSGELYQVVWNYHLPSSINVSPSWTDSRYFLCAGYAVWLVIQWRKKSDWSTRDHVISTILLSNNVTSPKITPKIALNPVRRLSLLFLSCCNIIAP